eukprot:9469089-Pyramimonas_sp.AAC.1
MFLLLLPLTLPHSGPLEPLTCWSGSSLDFASVAPGGRARGNALFLADTPSAIWLWRCERSNENMTPDRDVLVEAIAATLRRGPTNWREWLAHGICRSRLGPGLVQA